MATVDSSFFGTGQTPVPSNKKKAPSSAKEKRPLHRIEEVRKRQGMSVRSAARQMQVETRQVREEVDPTNDLSLSDLFRWQSVLGVPIAELLAEPDAQLSGPIMRRAQLVRVMKTVRALSEVQNGKKTERLVETLMSQLIDIMPELKDVGAWPSVGQRRSLNEYGRAADRLLSEDMLYRKDLG